MSRFATLLLLSKQEVTNHKQEQIHSQADLVDQLAGASWECGYYNTA